MGKTLAEIKQALDVKIGQQLTLKANGGRRKTIERFGVLAETYPSVFIVELDQDEHSFERVSLQLCRRTYRNRRDYLHR